jgi:hypothetical protein
MSTIFDFTYKINSETAQNQILSNVIAASTKKKYQPLSHFIVDETKLAAIDLANYAADAFGPVTGSLATKYRTTSKVRAIDANPVKVFAICDGQVLIQPHYDLSGSLDTTKINIVIKPSSSYNPLKIKYFIYRGVSKEDLIDNDNNLKVESTDVNQPWLLKKVWQQFKSFYTDAGGTAPTVFPASSIGYDASISELTLIEHIFSKKGIDGSLYQLPICAMGDHIANFSTEIGLDIVLDYGDYQLQNQEELFKFDLKYARKKEHVFDTASQTNAIKIKRLKEYIHQFIDAAAFWGSHIECGTIKTVGTPEGIKSNDDIFSKLVNKYQTRYKIYVYIQGENVRSYNYYDASRKVYGFDTDGKLNETSGWPITIEEITLSNATTTFIEGKSIQLEYNIASEIEETDRFVAIDIVAPNNNTSSYPLVIKPKNPIGTLPTVLVDKTPEATIKFPIKGTKSCATFLFLFTNLKQEASLKKYYNDLFPVNLNANFKLSATEEVIVSASAKMNLDSNSQLQATGAENESYWTTYDKSRLINLDDTIDAGAVIQNKVIFDNGKGKTDSGADSRKSRRLYMAILKRNSIHNQEYDALNIDTVTAGVAKETKTHEDYALNHYNDREFAVYKGTFTDVVAINSLSLFHQTSSIKKDSFFHLGITDEEYNKLVYGQSTVPEVIPPAPVPQVLPIDADNVFFYLESITFENRNVQKFKLGLRFENGAGNITTFFPDSTNEIFVYSVDGCYFFSKDFSNHQEFTSNNFSYIRNYEEAFGLKKVGTTDKLYEDWFIEKDSGMKAKVDAFINSLSQLNNVPYNYNNVKTLVENSALDIWNQAVSTVQANANTTPDDRPLYWARIKMQVKLKSHKYFAAGNNGKDLKELIKIFEEKSRNYKGVDFSSAPNRKKILITGFDPFQLDSNIYQSNPSGVCASYLHGKTLGNAYIQTMIFPVRYADFDSKKSRFTGKGNGVVEDYIKPFIGHDANDADMVITISQSGVGNYNIDRFATINRGGGSDNMNAIRDINSDSVILSATEQDLIWIETSLPKAMVMNGGATQLPDQHKHYAVYAQHYTLLNENSAINEDPTYVFNWDVGSDNYKPANPALIFTADKKEHNLLESNGKKKRIIEGSGSDYLSNEIFYRVALARERWQRVNPGQKFPTGHFHIAKIQVGTRDLSDKYLYSNRTIYDELTKLIKTVEERITLGVDTVLTDPNNLF